MNNLPPTLILFVFCLENVLAPFDVIQWPPRLRAMSGGNVTLPCEFRRGGGWVTIIYPYWFINGSDGGTQIIYPNPRSSHYRGRVSLVSEESGPDLSLEIRHLRTNDSNVYYCMVSTLIHGNQLWIQGNGTRLDVFGPSRHPLAFYILVLLKTIALLVLGATYLVTKK